MPCCVLRKLAAWKYASMVVYMSEQLDSTLTGSVVWARQAWAGSILHMNCPTPAKAKAQQTRPQSWYPGPTCAVLQVNDSLARLINSGAVDKHNFKLLVTGGHTDIKLGMLSAQPQLIFKCLRLIWPPQHCHCN